jgi:hypothetical protein
MNVKRFFEHWGLAEHPFLAEEARHDPVFGRLGAGETAHPEFEKILGDLSRPSTSIVFGEKGSGKTAIRLQVEQRVAEHNLGAGDARVLLVAYDDLNPVIDAVCARRGAGPGSADRAIEEAMGGFRLVDHMDAILQRAVESVVDRTLDTGPEGNDLARRLRRAPMETRRDLLGLQAVYDRESVGGERTLALRRRIGVGRDLGRVAWRAAAWAGWLAPAAALVAWYRTDDALFGPAVWRWVVYALAALWLASVAWVVAIEPLWRRRRAWRIARSVGGRPTRIDSVAGSLGKLGAAGAVAGELAPGSSEESRYAAFDRLRSALRAMGFSGVIVVMDRVDEPALVQGDAARMRAVVWPLLNNKFLQMDGLGLKLLLPIELRYELFRESSSFFQEARMDKQGLVERLSWTGAMLYDLCEARMEACRAEGAEAVGLNDLFDADVTRTDLVDALDQMHQPRDAFKFLYQCVGDHCSGTTADSEAWRIPRLTLEMVKRQQSERVQMLQRGVRPA